MCFRVVAEGLKNELEVADTDEWGSTLALEGPHEFKIKISMALLEACRDAAEEDDRAMLLFLLAVVIVHELANCLVCFDDPNYVIPKKSEWMWKYGLDFEAGDIFENQLFFRDLFLQAGNECQSVKDARDVRLFVIENLGKCYLKKAYIDECFRDSFRAVYLGVFEKSPGTNGSVFGRQGAVVNYETGGTIFQRHCRYERSLCDEALP